MEEASVGSGGWGGEEQGWGGEEARVGRKQGWGEKMLQK